MVQIAGKYKLESNENFASYVMGLGIPEEMAKKVDSLRPVMEIVINGTDYKITSDSGVQNSSTCFTLGKEFDDPMPNGSTLKSTASLVGEKIVIKSVTADGRNGERTYEFTPTHCVVTFTSTVNSIVAKRTYSRI